MNIHLTAYRCCGWAVGGFCGRNRRTGNTDGRSRWLLLVNYGYPGSCSRRCVVTIFQPTIRASSPIGKKRYSHCSPKGIKTGKLLRPFLLVEKRFGGTCGRFIQSLEFMIVRARRYMRIVAALSRRRPWRLIVIDLLRSDFTPTGKDLKQETG